MTKPSPPPSLSPSLCLPLSLSLFSFSLHSSFPRRKAERDPITARLWFLWRSGKSGEQLLLQLDFNGVSHGQQEDVCARGCERGCVLYLQVCVWSLGLFGCTHIHNRSRPFE